MPNSSDVWTGKASDYDRVRPTPPAALLDLLMQMIGTPHPALVVDLGSGTGLATVVWGERAERVIGIEPNADMRRVAAHKIEGTPYATQIEYREGFAQQTGLSDGCADIVTAAQAFHWMEPAPALAEIARILRPGGLFAAYDYDAPPTVHWELDRVAHEMTQRWVALVRKRGLPQNLKLWPKDKHLDNMRASGHFRYTSEVALHSVEHGDATRYLAMMQSTAFSQQAEFSDQEIGFDRLRQAAYQYIGAEPDPWYWSYRVRIAVK